jgi:histone H4
MPVRHRALAFPRDGISKPAIRRLARRGGVKRLSGLVYDEMRALIEKFVRDLVGTAAVYAESRRGGEGGKVITAIDVVYGLKRTTGVTFYSDQAT